jgi:hypothetical protein
MRIRVRGYSVGFVDNIGVRRGVSKGVEGGRRPTALWEGQPLNGHFRGGPPTGCRRVGHGDPG